MQQPLEIAFHNMESSPALEAELRERFAKLEKLCDQADVLPNLRRIAA
jgi:hypothetical protein